jgi:rhamnogalacturonan endolyase
MVTLGNLNQTYTGLPNGVTVTTAPASLPLIVTYNGIASVPTAAGSYAVIATVNSPNHAGSASGTLVISPAPATITLGNLNQEYDGEPKHVTIETIPAGLAVAATYAGGAAPPINAGTYAVSAFITDPNYAAASADFTFTVSPAPVVVTLDGLAQTYDGTPRTASATTLPAALPVTVMYDGSFDAPTGAGTYAVVATVANLNYSGIASGAMVINKANATFTLAPLTQIYDGTPRVVTAMTAPDELPVNISYNGSTSPPVYPGTYPLVATINDANYQGSVAQVLTVGITALVRHAPTLNGIVDGSVQVLEAENVTLNGNASIAGDLLMPGTPTIQLNGQPIYGGTLDGPGLVSPTNHRVTLNGGAVVRHVVRRIDAIELPTVNTPPLPVGTRDVILNNPGQSAGSFATLRHLTLNGNVGPAVVPPGTYGNFTANGASDFIFGVAGATEPSIYNLQNLVLNGKSELQIAGPVVLTLAHGGMLNATLGNAEHPEWLVLQVFSGGVTLNGNIVLSGRVIAPNGTVTINGSSSVIGEVASDRLVLNGNGLLSEVTP